MTKPSLLRIIPGGERLLSQCLQSLELQNAMMGIYPGGSLLQKTEQARLLNQLWRESFGETMLFWIFLSKTSSIAGVVYFTNLNPIDRRAVCSVYIFPEFQNRSLGISSVYQACLHGFGTLNLRTLYFVSHSDNTRMERIYRRLNFFKHNATLQNEYWREGKWRHVHIYSLNDKDYFRYRKDYGSILERKQSEAPAYR